MRIFSFPQHLGFVGAAKISNMVTLSKEDGASHSSRSSGQLHSPILCSGPGCSKYEPQTFVYSRIGLCSIHSIHPPKRLLFLSSVHIWMILTLQQCFQVSLLAVDEMHMSLPKMKKDIYWDDSAARPPYTLAAADYCIPSFLGSTVQMA